MIDHYLKFSKLLIIIITIIFIDPGILWSQKNFYRHFETEEDSLHTLFNLIEKNKNDSQKINLNKIVIEILDATLNDDLSFTYPFDSLKHLGKITSPDKLFRIYTWNLVFNDGSYKYFGFIQYYREKRNEYIVYQLHDNSNNIINPENVTLEPMNWYGALYYEIIKNKYSRRTYYTLLGWDGNNDLTRKKVIDVLRFGSSGKPAFGANIFKFDKKKRKRIFFEYSAKTNMTLTYNEKHDMIVFDHLSPSESSYKGLYQYYGPDFSYDAMYFDKGKWQLVKDVDVRNPRMKLPKGKWHYNRKEDFVK